MKLNWRDASKELPTKDFDCAVLTECGTIYADNYNKRKWSYSSEYSDVITHWLLIDEIPLPEEEL